MCPGRAAAHCPAEWGSRARRLSGADHIGEDAISAGHAGRQLAEPGVRSEDVHALAVARIERAARQRLFARIVRLEDRLILLVPFRGEVESALLHPALEIPLGNLIRFEQ